MQVEKKAIVFEDQRGSIRDILIGKEVDAVTILVCKKGSVRGNHFHKQSIQYGYIVSGSFVCATQIGDNPIETKELKTGDIITHPPGEKHAFKALEDSVFLALTKGPRQGTSYEKDTFHLEKLILK